MSMKELTILQFFCALGIYSFMVMLLPALIFYRKLKNERFCTRIFFYLIIGNFYLMNLVFLLQLLHISNRVTLILGTLVPAVWAGIRLNKIPVRIVAERLVETLFKLSKGTLGTKLFRRSLIKKLVCMVWGLIRRTFVNVRKNMMEWILFVCLTVFLLWIYGTGILQTYGYTVSDTPVHNYWINYMGKNQIFVAGVYPFGFHCIIYYLHAVFGMETFVLLRVFGVVQMLFIHYVLLVFLRGCCKTRYTAFGVVIVYAAASFFNIYTYIRYYSSLPQEFGMIFILPSIYFLFLFFKARKKETGWEKGAKVRWQHSTWYLCGFAMSFAMTFAIHFYDTMIAGLFCLGIAVGYAFRLFRREYFGRVILAGIISIAMAVLPMAVAFATGTPLQGSLNWGMKVISGELEDGQESELLETETGQEETEQMDANSQAAETAGENQVSDTEHFGNQNQMNPKNSETFRQKIQASFEQILNRLRNMGVCIRENFRIYVMPEADAILRLSLLILPVILMLTGLCAFIAKEREYGSILLSTGCFLALMLVIHSAKELSLPELMDKNRSSIYLAYLLPVAAGLTVDAVLWGILGRFRKKYLMHGASLFVTAAMLLLLVNGQKIKEPAALTGLESNAAITCLTNILRENENQTFTVCSANDELRMVEDYGFHYETIRFLTEMEGEMADGMLTLPTRRVYFFIEKIPLEYGVVYEKYGQKISEEGAAHALPEGSGLSIYQGENRWIVMSRMYYWAEKFMSLYENEMRVYYETDDFICYEIEQNPYRLYDFSIDYGFNTAAFNREED